VLMVAMLLSYAQRASRLLIFVPAIVLKTRQPRLLRQRVREHPSLGRHCQKLEWL